MSKIWLDVTTILGWQRPAVGIVRVEAECAAYATRSTNKKIHFCNFCNFCMGRGYLEIDPADVQIALDRIYSKETIKIKDAIYSPTAGIERKIDSAASMKKKLIALINLLPNKLQVPTLNFFIKRKYIFRAILKSYRELKFTLRNVFRPSSAENLGAVTLAHKKLEKNTVPFKMGDVYVSLGLDWDQKDLVYIYEQKRNIGFKTLFFCYDLIPLKFPHLCVGDVSAKFANYFSNLAWSADEIICISKHTKKDLKALITDLGPPVVPMSVIKLGCKIPKIKNQLVAKNVEEIITQRYILYVSTIERRKNHETLYRAYTRLLDQGEDHLPLLVFVGMQGWGVDDFLTDLQFDPRIKGLIKVLNHVSDADLNKLYQNSLFTVYPSLYEGWGLPIAESLAAGKFCLASNAASLPEVGGDFIEYLDPWDVPKWAEQLKWYFDHPELVAKISARIASEYKPTPWEATAAFVIERANHLAMNKI